MLHIRQHYLDELASLEQQLLQMGTLTTQMIATAVEALQQGDVALAESVIAQDDAVDALDLEIESHCMSLLALQQPMARDLRQIGTALKVVTDLERIGDHAVDIAKVGRKLTQQFLRKSPLVDIGRLARMAQQMLAQSVEALVRHDTALATQICADDDAVDAEFKRLREELLGVSQADPAMIAPAAYTLLAMVHLERVADHATNIAERVNYVETGRLEQLARSHRLDQVADLASEAA